jgi:hypothetical protein
MRRHLPHDQDGHDDADREDAAEDRCERSQRGGAARRLAAERSPCPTCPDALAVVEALAPLHSS